VWHREMDHFFEGIYVLVRTDSPLARTRSEMRFDSSNVAAAMKDTCTTAT
jgi:hypothetical protein